MSLQHDERTVDLDIEGMTCASCVARVEKRLGRIEGVQARVNLATERARVRFASNVEVAELVEAVRAAGYAARVRSGDSTAEAAPAAEAGAAQRVVSTPIPVAIGARPVGLAPGAVIAVAPSTEPAVASDAAPVAPASGTVLDVVESEPRSLDVDPPVPNPEPTPAPTRRDPLRLRLVVSATLTVPVVVLAMVPALQFPAWQWVSLVLATPVVLWGGWPFHRAAAVNLRHGGLTMDTLVSLGTLTAYAWSAWALWFGDAGMIGMTHGWSFGVRGTPGGDIYLEVAAGVVTILLLGRVIEARSKRRAGASLRTLLDLAPREVTVLQADGDDDADADADGAGAGAAREARVAATALRPGGRFVVRPGERIAADGVVEHGEASIDESMLTGEPAPVDVAPGSTVTAATIVHGGRLVVRATRVGADTRLAQIARLVEDAQLGGSRAQRLADRVAAVFVPIVIAISAGTAAAWLLTGSPVEQAMTAAVAVLVIACPCALGLATPVAVLVGTGRGAERGILITGPEVLDRTADVDTILLDKTGTLTTGRMRLGGVTPSAPHDRDERRAAARALGIAAALERGSEHPIARAVVAGAEAAGADHFDVDGFRAHSGLGVTGVVDGVEAAAGRPAFLADLGHRMPRDLAARVAESDASLVMVGWNGEVRALLEVGDDVRDGARDAVAHLREQGLRPAIATGDTARAAERVAQQVGIDEVHAGLTPEGKLAIVRRLQADGRRVAMAGDGVNDAAALAAADLGIAMGGGTDAAASASDLALLRDDPSGIPDAIALARATRATIRGNLFWAFAYNVAAIPLAAAGFLNPMIAGAAMAFSSVFVVLNSLRLRSA